jgi:hypothetical protein
MTNKNGCDICGFTGAKEHNCEAPKARETSEKVRHAVGLHYNWMRAEAKLEKLGKEMGDFVATLTDDEVSEYVKLTTQNLLESATKRSA